MAAQMSDFEKREFADRLVRARNEAGLSQDEAARAIGITPRRYQSWEAGESIPFKRLSVIAEKLDTTKEWLLHGDPQAPLSDKLMEAMLETNALLRRLLDERKRDSS